MSSVRRGVIAIGFAIALLAIPGTAYACEPYTFGDEEDWFRLSDGLQWSFAGVVTDEISNPEIPDRPQAVDLRIDETLIGRVSLARLRVVQDAGCDGFWYRQGDRVIAAIGRMRGVRPPFEDITNYAVAVWVIRDGVIVPGLGPHSRPWVAGQAPRTERQLRAWLLALPDTATAPPVESPPIWSWAVLLPALGGAIGAAAVWRRPA